MTVGAPALSSVPARIDNHFPVAGLVGLARGGEDDAGRTNQADLLASRAGHSGVVRG